MTDRDVRKRAFRIASAVLAAGVMSVAPAGAAAAELVYQLEVTGFPSNNQVPANRQQQLTFTAKIHPNAPASRTSTSATGKVCLRPIADWEWVGAAPSLPQLANRQATGSATGTIKAKGTWTTAHNTLFTAGLGGCPDNQQSTESNEVSKSLAVATGTGGTAVAVTQIAVNRDHLLSYGWTRKMGSGGGAGTKLGNAEDTISGHSIGDIVTRADVKVRADNKACTECHGWAAASTRQSFCAKTEAFNGQAGKPQLLKDIFNRWKLATCPN